MRKKNQKEVIEMKMKKLMLLGAIFGSGLLAYNCGGGGGGDTASSGTVSFALTDAYYSGQDITRLMVNIKEVRMENPATGLSCTLFSDQNGITMNLPELANSMRLIDVTNCEAGTYTQFSIVMDQWIEVDVFTDVCYIDPSLTKADGKSAWEDDMQVSCDPQTGTCTITVGVEDGGLVVQPGVNNQVALDFEISDSDKDGNSVIVVTPDANTSANTPNGCGVAFEIEEIEPEEMENHMEQNSKKWEIEGTIANLDTNSRTFTLQLDSGLAFTVSYNDTTTITTNAGNLENGIRVEVECSAFDLNNATCQATSIKQEQPEV